MIKYIFIFFWLLMYLIFTWLAFSNKSIKTYVTGCLTSLFYFIAVSEGLVYSMQNKIPLIGFLVDPFPGEYKLIMQNILHHWIYYAIIIAVEIFFFVRLNKKLKGSRQNILTNAAPQA